MARGEPRLAKAKGCFYRRAEVYNGFMEFNRTFLLMTVSLVTAANLGAASGQQSWAGARAGATKKALFTGGSGQSQGPKTTSAQSPKPAVGQSPKPTPTPA